MQDELYEDELPVEQPLEPEPVDENSLGFILGKALNEISNIGGRDRALLAQTIGRGTYDRLLSKASTRRAIDTWLDASPKTKPAATRLLSTAIARELDTPDLIERMVREITDQDPFDERPNVPPMKATPNKAQV